MTEELRNRIRQRAVGAKCVGCKAITEQWIPGELPVMICGKHEKIENCGGPFTTFETLFDSIEFTR